MNMLLNAKNVFPLLIYSFFSISFSQTNLIANGNFESDSGWNNLGIYNGGEATGIIEGGAYVITITRPGQEYWSIQLTQPHIKLKKNVAYVVSFAISASVDRTVEVTLARNGGDYVSYSGKDTLSVSSARRNYTKRFIMKHESDGDARLEFNCGGAEGTISIRNVSLFVFTDRILQMGTPQGNERLISGAPFTIKWSSVNLSGQLSIEFSGDNGANWKEIALVEPDSSPFIWIPEEIYSPWCYVRIVSIDTPKITVENAEPFEIAPQREIIKNGTFTDSMDVWSFNVNNAKVEHSISPYGGYIISIIEKGNENRDIQLTQDHILLKQGVTYRYSFLASGHDTPIVKVDIKMNADPYTSYLDSTDRMIKLTALSQRYSRLFIMNAPTDSNARFEFSCGRANGTLHIDEVSIIPEYIVQSITGEPATHYTYTPSSSTVKSILMHHAPLTYQTGFEKEGRYRVFDLRGRLLTGGNDNNAYRSSKERCYATGVHVIKRVIRSNHINEE